MQIKELFHSNYLLRKCVLGNGCVYTCVLSRLSSWPEKTQTLHGAHLSEGTDPALLKDLLPGWV